MGQVGRREPRPGRTERARTQTIPSPKRRWNAENKSPKALVSFMPQELNRYQNVQQNQTNSEAMENV